MKLGINSVTFKDEKPIRRIELSKEIGFKGIEILGFPREMTLEIITDTRKALKEHDLDAPLVALGPPLALSGGELAIESQDPNVRNSTFEHIKKCIDCASELGSEMIYVCTTRPKAEFTDQMRALEDTKRFLIECADYASKCGIKVAIEHSPGSLIDKASYLNEILKELNVKNLGALLDIGHLNMTKEDVATTVMNTEKIYDLRPVSFTPIELETTDENRTFGLIAEEVVELFPEIVPLNEKGQPESVNYPLVSVLLLNEVQKHQERITELEDRILALEELLNK